MPIVLKNIFSLASQTIIELYERLPPIAHRIGEPVIKGVKIFLCFISEIRLQILLFDCLMPNSSNRFRLLYVGRANQAQAVMALLGCHASHPVLLKSVLPWNLADYLNDIDLNRELTIIHVNKLLYRYLKPADFLRIPVSVNLMLNLAETKEDTQAFFSENVRRKQKRVISQGFSWEIRNDKPALTYFYRHIYKPYAMKRFGPFAKVLSFYKVRRLFRTGFLIVVSRNGEIVSAGICKIIQGGLWFEISGLEQGNSELLSTGASDALYQALFEFACELNCACINFRDSRPFLNEGTLKYKQGWGARLLSNRKACREIGVKMNLSEKCRYNPFFDIYPIFIDHGNLSGLVLLNHGKAVTVREIKKLEKTYMKPGLKKLHIFSLNGFDEEVPRYISKNDSRIMIFDPSNVSTSRVT